MSGKLSTTIHLFTYSFDTPIEALPASKDEDYREFLFNSVDSLFYSQIHVQITNLIFLDKEFFHDPAGKPAS